jgi:hypothetical protein
MHQAVFGIGTFELLIILLVVGAIIAWRTVGPPRWK